MLCWLLLLLGIIVLEVFDFCCIVGAVAVAVDDFGLVSAAVLS